MPKKAAEGKEAWRSGRKEVFLTSRSEVLNPSFSSSILNKISLQKSPLWISRMVFFPLSTPYIKLHICICLCRQLLIQHSFISCLYPHGACLTDSILAEHKTETAMPSQPRPGTLCPALLSPLSLPVQLREMSPRTPKDSTPSWAF